MFASGIGTDDVQLVPRNVRCRLMSVQFEQQSVGAGSSYYSMKFNTGGSSGTTNLQFGYNNMKSVPQVLNIPSHGILFEDGIYLIPDGTAGLESISITYQG